MDMLDSAIRVRVDFLPPDAAARRADVVVPGDVAVAEVLPELLDVFGSGPAPGASWRVRLPDGSAADPERGFAAAGVRDGDRLRIVDDPGPVPAPLVTDVTDALADSVPGVGVADGWVGSVAAVAGTVAMVVAALAMSPTDPVLAAGLLGAFALAAAAGARIAFRRGGSAPTVAVLCAQAVVASGVAGSALTGVPVADAASDWRFPAGAVPGAALASAVALIVSPARAAVAAATAAIGAAGAVLAVFSGVAAVLLAVAGTVPAAAGTLACAAVALTMAPGICVAVAGVRVPRIPAAGEPFADDSPDAPSGRAPEGDGTRGPGGGGGSDGVGPGGVGGRDGVGAVAHRAGRLLDGAMAALAVVIVVASLPLVSGAQAGATATALVAAVLVSLLIQSRGHARSIPSGALALAAAALLIALAWAQWHYGRWPVALLLVLPVLAANALPAMPATRVSPTARRAMELAEATALAVSLPLAAAVAGVPEWAGGLLR